MKVWKKQHHSASLLVRPHSFIQGLDSHGIATMIRMFIIAGVVFYYSLIQLAMFWLCHVLALFWKIRFPFHSRSFQMAHRTKYVHIAAVVLCILVPFVPIVATMSQYGHGRSSVEAATGGLGFGITRFPPLLCTGRHADTTFYSLILPILVILMIGMTILLFIFWIIHRVSHTIITKSYIQ